MKDWSPLQLKRFYMLFVRKHISKKRSLSI